MQKYAILINAPIQYIYASMGASQVTPLLDLFGCGPDIPFDATRCCLPQNEPDVDLRSRFLIIAKAAVEVRLKTSISLRSRRLPTGLDILQTVAMPDGLPCPARLQLPPAERREVDYIQQYTAACRMYAGILGPEFFSIPHSSHPTASLAAARANAAAAAAELETPDEEAGDVLGRPTKQGHPTAPTFTDVLREAGGVASIPSSWPVADPDVVATAAADLDYDTDETDNEIANHEFGSLSRWSVTKARASRLRLHAFRCSRSAAHSDRWQKSGVATVWPSIATYNTAMSRAFPVAPPIDPGDFILARGAKVPAASPPVPGGPRGSAMFPPLSPLGATAAAPLSPDVGRMAAGVAGFEPPPGRDAAAAGARPAVGQGGGASARAAAGGLLYESIYARHPSGATMPMLCHGDPPLWMTDEAFCAARLVGPNAASLQLVERESWLTGTFMEMQFATISGRMEGFKNIDQAIQARRVFMVDHTVYLNGFVSKMVGRHAAISCPQALFFVDSKKILRPLAVVVMPPGDLRYPINPIFTPDDNVWAWLAAKMMFNAGDLLVHLVVNITVRTFLIAGLVMCLVFRTLHPVHPFAQLVRPHLGFTVGHWASWQAAMPRLLGSATGLRPEGTRVMGERAWAKMDVNNLGFANSVTLRVPDPKLLGDRYRFATDGMEMWEANLEYAHSVVKHMYPTAVIRDHDTEGREFLRELTTFTNRPMEYFGNSNVYPMSFNLATANVVASLQASLFCDGLYDWYGCVPFAPLRPRTQFPRLDQGKDAVTEADVAAMLPTTRDMIRQMALMHILSGRPLPADSLASAAAEATRRAARAVVRPVRRAGAAVAPVVAKCMDGDAVVVATMRELMRQAARVVPAMGPQGDAVRYEGESSAGGARWSTWAAGGAAQPPGGGVDAGVFGGLPHATAGAGGPGRAPLSYDLEQILAAARAEGAPGKRGGSPVAPSDVGAFAVGSSGDGGAAATASAAPILPTTAAAPPTQDSPAAAADAARSAAGDMVFDPDDGLHAIAVAAAAAGDGKGSTMHVAGTGAGLGRAPTKAEIAAQSLTAVEQRLLQAAVAPVAASCGRGGGVAASLGGGTVQSAEHLLLSLSPHTIKDARCVDAINRLRGRLARIACNVAERNATVTEAIIADGMETLMLTYEGRPTAVQIRTATVNTAYRAAMWQYRAADPLRVPQTFARHRTAKAIISASVLESAI